MKGSEKFKTGYVVWADGEVGEILYCKDNERADDKFVIVFDGQTSWRYRRANIFDEPPRDAIRDFAMRKLKVELEDLEREVDRSGQQEQFVRDELERIVGYKQQVALKVEDVKAKIKRLQEGGAE